MRSTILLPLAAAASAATAQIPAPPVPPAPPKPTAGPVASAAEPVIVRFRADPPRCGGAEARPTLAEEPFPTGYPSWTPPRREAAPGSVLVRFRIAADGRPLDIRAERRPGGPPVETSDVAPAFAAWRFQPGRERRDCEALFSMETSPVDAADEETLYRFLALHPASRQPLLGSVGHAAFRRIVPAGSSCAEPRPNVRLQAYPPFEEIPQAQGTVSYSFMRYDIGRDGRTRNVALVSTSGNAVLDRESLRAIRMSRFEPGVRTGCAHYFFRRQPEPMPAPAVPEEAAYRTEDATCPKEEPGWAYMPPLEFPANFNRRGIEGWAIVRFDIAPDGTTRNVRTLDFAPAADFGERGARIVRTGRKNAADRGYEGCIARVIFRLPRGPELPPKGG
jgi:hypothetical protein